MKNLKRLFMLTIALAMLISAFVLPAAAVEIDHLKNHTDQVNITYDPGCPVCGKVGTFMYDTVMPDPIPLTLATYYCEEHGVYQFYRLTRSVESISIS